MAINSGIQNLIDSNRKLSSTDVNNLFYYFYGKSANSAEQSYWGKKTSGQLSNALKPNAKQFQNAGYYKDVISAKTSNNTSNNINTSSNKEKSKGSWNITGASMNQDGSWNKKPVLTVDGKTLNLNTPEEYRDKLNELKSSGYPGTSDLNNQLGFFNNFVDYYQSRNGNNTKQKKMQAVIDKFNKYGYEPSNDDIEYWMDENKSNEYGNLEDNLKRRKEQSGETLEETSGNVQDLSMYDSYINNDAFLKEQFEDQNIKDNFSKMSPTLQMAYLQMMKSLGAQVEAGKVINPNIEITPEQVKKFTDQAISELDPYYQEQISNYKQDLDTSISRLTEDFETGVRNAEDPFKRNLEVVAENEAQAGTVYGSERKKREDINVQNQQQAIDEVSKGLGRDVEDSYTKAERTLGSDVLSGIKTPKIAEYKVSNQGISKTGSRDLFDPKGGMIGSLQKEKTTAVKSRSSELEEDYRKQRILNINI